MAEILKLARGLIRDLTTPYRPELHYMRGPGPAWRAKHPAQSVEHGGPALCALAHPTPAPQGVEWAGQRSPRGEIQQHQGSRLPACPARRY